MNLKEKICYVLVLFLYGMLCLYVPFNKIITSGQIVKETTIRINAGMTAVSVANLLKERNVIQNRKLFLKYMQKSGLDRHIKTGTYKIYPGYELYVIKQLQNYKPQLFRVTIVPGTTLDVLIQNLGVEQETLRDALMNNNNFPKDIVPFLPDDHISRISFLIPETYCVNDSANKCNEVIQLGSQLWYTKIFKNFSGSISKEEWLRRATMASIIEKEAKLDNEKKRMAGVFYNRLDKGMKLQSCATVVYAWSLRDITKKRLTYKDLEIDSPYNTYLYTNLPPKPICIPSITSWTASLEPESNTYLFFVAQSEGSHIFSKTYREHIRAQKKINDITRGPIHD